MAGIPVETLGARQIGREAGAAAERLAGARELVGEIRRQAVIGRLHGKSYWRRWGKKNRGRPC